MKNYQIFNAYPAFVKIAELNYNDYDINVDVALMLMELEKRYKIITKMIDKLQVEYYQAHDDGQFVVDENGNYVIKSGKSLVEFEAELAKLSDADANYNPEKIVIYRNSFRDKMPNPKEIVQLQDFVIFKKED